LHFGLVGLAGAVPEFGLVLDKLIEYFLP